MNLLENLKIRKRVILLPIFIVVLVFLFGCENQDEKDLYTVTFSTNISVDIVPVTIEEGETVDELDSYHIVGYSFEGWFTDEQYNQPYDLESEVHSDIVLYGLWTPNEYSYIVYDAEDRAIYSETYLYGESLDGLFFGDLDHHNGYKFIEWDNEFPETMPAEDVEIRPVYGDTQYRIITIYTGLATEMLLLEGEEIVLTDPIPSHSSLEFGGWYLDAYHTVPLDYTHMPNENISVYPKWNIKQYSLAYLDYDGTVLQYQFVDIGADLSDITPPEDPFLEGYVFVGWDQDIPDYMPEEAITIKAEYRIEELPDVPLEIHDLPTETSDFLEDLEVTYIKELNDVLYIVYITEQDDTNIVVLNNSFEIMHIIEALGPVYDIYDAPDDNLMVEYLVELSKNYAVYNHDGELLHDMKVNQYVGLYIDTPHVQSPLYIGDGTYVYFERFRDPDTGEYTLELIKNSGDEEVLLTYTYDDYIVGRVIQLSNDTLLVNFVEDISLTNRMLIQLDFEGNIIFSEGLIFDSLYLLSEGYLVETYWDNFQKRNNDSTIVWEKSYEATSFVEETEDTLVLRNGYSSSEIDEIVVDKETGDIISTTYKTPHSNEPEVYYDTWDNGMTSEYYYEIIDDKKVHHLTLKNDNNETIATWNLDLDHYIRITVKTNRVYIFWKEDTQYIINKYSLQGELLMTYSIDGIVMDILNSGNFIVEVDDVTSEIDEDGTVLWSSEYSYFRALDDDLYLMGTVEYWRTFWDIDYNLVLMDGSGTIIGDYIWYDNSLVTYENDEYFVMVTEGQNYLFILDMEGNIVQQFDYLNTTQRNKWIYQISDGNYYCIINGQLVIFDFGDDWSA